MFKNVFGFSFYALDRAQATEDLINGFGKVEAILFSRDDLSDEKWEIAWKNIKEMVDIKGKENVSFHFPMDNCDYVNDNFVRNRLEDAVRRANKLGIKKIVIHPNLRYQISEWKYIDRNKMRDILYEIVSNIKSDKTLLCIENMPPIGNKYDDGDSAIIFMDDLTNGCNYTLDICHYFNVVETMKKNDKEKAWKEVLAEIKVCDYFDFLDKLNYIKHFHFSAFREIANPFENQVCIEGILPNDSCVDEDIYKLAMKIIYEDAVSNDKSIIFEISEEDYTNRKNIFKMLEWAKKNVEK